MIENDTFPFGLGWVRDLPDARDYNLDTNEVKPFVVKKAKDILEPKVQLSINLPPLREQGKIGSCTAHSGTYLYDIHQRVAGFETEALSRRFLYKVSRNLLGWSGDTGSYLRTTMQAIAMFGVPPERYFQYNETDYDLEPSAFVYGIAQNYQGLTYYRLDPFGTPPGEIIERIKANIKLNRGCMFGFIVYGFDNSGNVLLPSRGQRSSGGHAVTVVGYDDERKILHPNGVQTTGAFKFANWWGKSWGEDGFGWLPYEYVKAGMATDWWTLMTTEWLDIKQFA